MRYNKDRKDLTRKKIVDTAGRAFRRDGIVASGVAALMSEAGLTPGGLYGHFPSKDALIAEALDDAIAKTAEDISNLVAAARAAGEHPLGRVIDTYLSEVHLNSVEISCALASLGGELSRQADAGRSVAARRIDETVSILAETMPEDIRYRAAPLFAMLAGTMQMAWLAMTPAEQAHRLGDGRRAARNLIGAV